MTEYQTYRNIFWGYELDFPSTWQQQSAEQADWFRPTEESGEENLQGHLLIAADWIFPPQPLKDLWKKHIVSTAGGLGAKNVGSGPWKIGPAEGYEAEIILPKKENQRLWTGILVNGPLYLNLVTAHHIKAREIFEPVISKMLAEMRFLQHVPETEQTEDGLPLPQGYQQTSPLEIITDIKDVENWQAFSGKASMGELQAFYSRELIYGGWNILEFVSFPEQASETGFARLRVQKEGKTFLLGIMPSGEGTMSTHSRGNLVVKRI